MGSVNPNEETRKPEKRGDADGFKAEEQAGMKGCARELGANKTDTESPVLAKIAEMPELDRAIGEWLHAIIKATAPALSPYPRYPRDPWSTNRLSRT